MMNSILLYIVQNENEIPQQLVPSNGYYLVGREVRIVDNLGQVATFVAPQKVNANNSAQTAYLQNYINSQIAPMQATVNNINNRVPAVPTPAYLVNTNTGCGANYGYNSGCGCNNV